MKYQYEGSNLAVVFKTNKNANVDNVKKFDNNEVQEKLTSI